MAAEGELRYPAGGNAEALKRQLDEMLGDKQRRAATEHEAFLRDSQTKAEAHRALIDRLGVTREDLEDALREQRRALHDHIRQQRPRSSELPNKSS